MQKYVIPHLKFYFNSTIGSDANQEPVLERLRNEMTSLQSNENSNSIPSTSGLQPAAIRKRRRTQFPNSGMCFD